MRHFITFASILATGAIALAQGGSPRETATANVAGESVSVEYGRPSLKGRSFSELTTKLPEDRMWRAGSEQVTTLATGTDIMIGDKTVPAGKYSLYVYCPEDGHYALAINSVLGQPLGKVWSEAPPEMAKEPWPHFSYQKEIGDKEVARVPMKEVKTDAPVDMFTISLEEMGDGAVINMAWGEAAWSLDVKPAK
jgi:hypothetical protein